jgi:H+/Cl- antiporter ClcA
VSEISGKGQFVIVTEMSNHHLMVIPLMAAALIAHTASRLVCREGIYHALARGLLRRQDPEIHILRVHAPHSDGTAD